jgi:hypothetical protein
MVPFGPRSKRGPGPAVLQAPGSRCCTPPPHRHRDVLLVQLVHNGLTPISSCPSPPVRPPRKPEVAHRIAPRYARLQKRLAVTCIRSANPPPPRLTMHWLVPPVSLQRIPPFKLTRAPTSACRIAPSQREPLPLPLHVALLPPIALPAFRSGFGFLGSTWTTQTVSR